MTAFAWGRPPSDQPGEYHAGLELPVPTTVRYWWDGRYWSACYHTFWPEEVRERAKATLSEWQDRYWRKLIPTLEATIEHIKREVREDVALGRVPATVASYGDLHDHRDANCYGGLCEDEVFDALIEHFGGRDADEGMPQGMLDYINAAHDAVDAWIKPGGHLRETP